MGFNFRKSFKLGPARINLSKSGVGYSVGAGGVRYTKSPKRKKAKKSSPLWSLLKFFLLATVIIVVWTLIEEHPVVFGIIGALLLAGIIAYIVYVYRQTHPKTSNMSMEDPEQIPTPDTDEVDA